MTRRGVAKRMMMKGGGGLQTEPLILGILPYDLPFAGLVMQVHRLSINVWGVLLHYFGLPFDNILGTGVFPDCINIRI